MNDDERLADEDLRIEFKLDDRGWADCQVTTHEGVVEIIGFGDCTDAFGDFVRAGLLIATGALDAGFSFDGEPAEWRWVVEQRRFKPLLIKILQFPDISAHAADSEGDLVMSFKCAPDAFPRAVGDAAQGLLDVHGLDGFSARWRQAEFPLRALRALQAALAIDEPLRPAPAPSAGGFRIVRGQSR